MTLSPKKLHSKVLAAFIIKAAVTVSSFADCTKAFANDGTADGSRQADITQFVLTSAGKVGDQELSQMRAGFFNAAGAEFDFGANIVTQVNGQLALQTNLQWTAAGPQIQQLGLGAPIDLQSTAAINATGSALPDSLMLAGVEISNPAGGSTQLFNNVTAGHIQSVIINSSSGLAISQNTGVSLTVYNFQAWQLQLAQNALSSQLANQARSVAGLVGH